MHSDLDNAIANLYGGSFGDFVERRNTLAKELRAAGSKEAAATVKDARKPSRIAWALDITAQTSRDAIAALDAALADTLEAHAGKGDVRAAMANLRAAVREFASQAEYFAERAGMHLGAAALNNAVFAVLSSPDSLQQLRRGTLAEVPEAGGLDFLATLPAAAPAPRASAAKAPPAARAAAPKREEDEKAAREAAQRKAANVAEARKRSQIAQQALRDAEKSLRAAEAEVERAREEAETAAAQLRAAENNDL